MKKATFKSNNPHRHGYPGWGERDGEIVTIVYAPGEDPANSKGRLYYVKFSDGVQMHAFPHELINIHDDAQIIEAINMAHLASIIANATQVELRWTNKDGSKGVFEFIPATQVLKSATL